GADAFFVAFKIPNYLRRLFAEGGFSQAFVPVLGEYKNRHGDAEVRDLIDHVCGTLGLVLFCISVIGVIAAPLIIMIFAPGFLDDEQKFGLAAGMLRITFPYLLFISLTALAGGILNTYGRFAVPAFTPVLLNISLIACAIWLAPHMAEPVVALAWGVFIAGVVQVFFQVPFLMRIKRLPRPVFKRGHTGVSRVVRLMVPALFAISVTQINLVIDMLIASFLQTGSISWLYYSDRLMEFPLGVFGVALATVILPNLSEQHARGDASRFSHMLDWALRWTLLIGVPAAIGLIILAGPMLVTIFNYGEFSDTDVAMATRSLVCYAIGLTGFILIKVLANGFFSRQDTSTPVKIGVVAMLTNLVLNILLVFPLAHAGLALATSLAAFVNAGLLFYFLRRKKQFDADPGWAVFAGRIVIACAIMAAFLLYFVPATPDWLGFDVFERVWQMALWVVSGGLVYIATLWLGGLRPRHMLLNN
ncbi:MAG TPA: murein biosynthesis integral membrane protein MurJ, partial [Gammaproteobacteria bacterium]|nr:murein biosynthesis integral membrane protein MurJ [Gammaproteobacteria bacterium]